VVHVDDSSDCAWVHRFAPSFAAPYVLLRPVRRIGSMALRLFTAAQGFDLLLHGSGTRAQSLPLAPHSSSAAPRGMSLICLRPSLISNSSPGWRPSIAVYALPTMRLPLNCTLVL